MTSVNVDSEIAAKEKKALLKIAEEADQALKSYGKRCLISEGMVRSRSLEMVLLRHSAKQNIIRLALKPLDFLWTLL